MNRIIITLFTLSVCILNSGISAQVENVTEVTTGQSSSSIATTPKPTPNISCEVHKDCDSCVKNPECYYCKTTKECHYHFEDVIFKKQCNTGDAYYKTCKTSVKVLIIVFASLAGIVLLIITIVCCYCCCKKKRSKLSKDDLKWARQREERKQIAAERRQERAERTEEIRKKYGLVKDSNPYQRFDA